MGRGCGAGAGPDPPWFLPVCLAWGGTEPGGWDAALVGGGNTITYSYKNKAGVPASNPNKNGPTLGRNPLSHSKDQSTKFHL